MKFTRLKLLFITIIFSLICSTGCTIEGNYNTNPDSQQNERNQEARNNEIAAKNKEAKLNAEAKRNNETKLNEQAKLDNEAKRNLQALKNIEQKLEVLQNAIAAQNNEALANKEAALNAEALNNYIFAHLEELRQEILNNIIAAKNAEAKANAEVQQNKLAAKNAEAKANSEAQENAVASQNAEAKANLEALENIAKQLEVLQNTIAAQNAEALANKEAAQNAEALNNYIYAHLEELRQEIQNNIIAAQNAEAAANIEARNNAIALAALGIQVNPSDNIRVTIQENPEIEVLSAVQSTGKVTFTAEDGFTNYKWYVNGFNGIQATSQVFELNTANLTGGTYTVTVRAEKNGITFSASSYVELDKTAPARVSNLRVTSVNTSANKVSLAWTNPSDSDFSKAVVYWTESDGQHSKEVTGTAGAAASTDIPVSNAADTYEFKVKALDRFGNESSSKYVTSTMVMKVVSDGSYDLSTSKRWNTSISGFNFADVGKSFSFKFKFINDGAFSFANESGRLYVRTNKEKFVYWSSGTGSCEALSGDWDGWYEVKGTISNSANSTFAIVMNGDDVSGSPLFSNAALYITDFKFGTEGAMETVKNSSLSFGVYESNITPVKSYVTLSDAN